MFGLSFWEISLILAVALLVLGPKRLPALAKSVGKGLRELRRASTDLRSAIEDPLEEVRKPLRDMRDDLVGTVHNIEERIREESDNEDEPGRQVQRLGAGADEASAREEQRRRGEVEEVFSTYGREPELEAADEEERRRREVEELYAASAREDATLDADEAQDAPAAPDASPSDQDGPMERQTSRPDK